MSELSEQVNSGSLAYVEQLYQQYLTDAESIDPRWRAEFDNWQRDNAAAPLQIGPSFKRRSLFNPGPGGNGNGNGRGVPRLAPTLAPPLGNGNGHDSNGIAVSQTETSPAPSLQHRVDKLVRNYRVRGHIIAEIDPLGARNPIPDELNAAYYGFTEGDMDRPFFTSIIPGGSTRTLREIVAQLRNTYCRHIGVQFMHIDDLRVREWLQARMETTENTTRLSRKEQIRILTRLTDAVIFEQFIQKKFIGAKSFSLEGAESVIPLLDLAFEKAGDQGMQEIVIGMAHRGRLNVLSNIIGKSPQRIFREFEDIDPKLYLGRGDVKYHMGYSGDWRTRRGKNIHLSLCFNPSHLEFVNPIALGRMRAKQDRSPYRTRGERGMVILIHGDAAFAGEGVVQETLNLSQLTGYTTGGSLHIIVNNQIGFTTGVKYARSSPYATDVAKMLQSPIFHVNGESPEAVAQVVRLAMDFRMEFKRDVVIDMYCFRRRGHNEGDEPSYTQPVMYSKINARKPVREAYLDHLLKLGGVSQEDADRIAERRTEILEKELTAARSDSYIPRPQRKLIGQWADFEGGPEQNVDDVKTGISAEAASELLRELTQLPSDFSLHPKLKRGLKHRLEMADGKRPLDWAAAEALAIASLAKEGHRIRMSGQDAQRGTFSHRHAVFHDINDGHEFSPVAHAAAGGAPIEIVNSPLSEIGVLGFEYGYSLDSPKGLTIWEAQFGDFANVAQVVIDQFIASAEDKWNRLSGLVLLLPHGFEGQGPEHSSARLERYLMLAAEDNIQICNPTNPAQLFHLLRRQVHRRWRKPLVVMTPKSLLRHPKCVSPLEAITEGTYRRVIPSHSTVDRKDVSRVIMCSGKIYYDLADRRNDLGRDDVAIVRLEQYYPWPIEHLKSAFARYRDDVPVVWVQEEPENQGAWPFLRQRFCNRLFGRLPLYHVARRASSSPATGSRAAHQLEQDRILDHAFGELES